MRHLRKELRERNNKAFKEVFENANVVLSTNVSAGSRDLENFAQSIGLFDVVIIDEAA